MAYWWLKHFHIVCVGLTLVSFSLRAFWLWTMNPLLEARWARILPHVIDTCLLASALGMVSLLGWQTWMGAKILALIGYIGLGRQALRASTPAQRRYSLLGAYLVFAYIVAVAVTKQPTLGL